MDDKIILDFYRQLVTSIAKETEHAIWERLSSQSIISRDNSQPNSNLESESLPPTLTIDDVTEYFNTSKSTIERAIKTGELKCYKQGQVRKFKREWVLEYEEQLIADSETNNNNMLELSISAMTDNLPENLTIKQAAEYLNVSETSVKKAIRLQRLRSYKNGKSRRIKKDWVLEYEVKLIIESNG